MPKVEALQDGQLDKRAILTAFGDRVLMKGKEEKTEKKYLGLSSDLTQQPLVPEDIAQRCTQADLNDPDVALETRQHPSFRERFDKYEEGKKLLHQQSLGGEQPIRLEVLKHMHRFRFKGETTVNNAFNYLIKIASGTDYDNLENLSGTGPAGMGSSTLYLEEDG
ncbi:MAG: hypothetical protein V1760_00125, partial [Candidatus Peregrinibacteria bacterium]